MSLNVLVVDDSSDMRKVIIRTLNLIGVPIGEVFKQKLAGKARSARRVLDWVDMLFIDMNMPVMNGMEMLTYIRSNPETRDLPVLIISTENNPQRIHQINENRSGFIHKPFTPEALGEKIIELTGIPTAWGTSNGNKCGDYFIHKVILNRYSGRCGDRYLVGFQ